MARSGCRRGLIRTPGLKSPDFQVITRQGPTRPNFGLVRALREARLNTVLLLRSRLWGSEALQVYKARGGLSNSECPEVRLNSLESLKVHRFGLRVFSVFGACEVLEVSSLFVGVTARTLLPGVLMVSVLPIAITTSTIIAMWIDSEMNSPWSQIRFRKTPRILCFQLV